MTSSARDRHRARRARLGANLLTSRWRATKPGPWPGSGAPDDAQSSVVLSRDGFADVEEDARSITRASSNSR